MFEGSGIKVQIFAWPYEFFLTALPCSGGYHMERDGMPLLDAVGINCKYGATTEDQGVYVDDCVCVI